MAICLLVRRITMAHSTPHTANYTQSDSVIKRYKKLTLAWTECLTASHSVPNGTYGPYAHITSLGNACGAKLKAHARTYSRICAPWEPMDAMHQWGESNGGLHAPTRPGSECLSIVRPSWYHSVVLTSLCHRAGTLIRLRDAISIVRSLLLVPSGR